MNWTKHKNKYWESITTNMNSKVNRNKFQSLRWCWSFTAMSIFSARAGVLRISKFLGNYHSHYWRHDNGSFRRQGNSFSWGCQKLQQPWWHYACHHKTSSNQITLLHLYTYVTLFFRDWFSLLVLHGCK